MRHRKAGRKLGRSGAHRIALLRNLVTSLLEHEQIETTDAKAKELRRVADRMITLGKRADLHARRQALAVVRSREVVGKLFGPLAERYAKRPGGYTRVLKLRTRMGDAAPISLVELVDRGAAAPEPEKPEKTRKKAAAKPKAPAKAKAEAAAKKPAARRKKAAAG